MAFAILIGLWIQYESSFDKFHSNRDRIGLMMKQFEQQQPDLVQGARSWGGV